MSAPAESALSVIITLSSRAPNQRSLDHQPRVRGENIRVSSFVLDHPTEESQCILFDTVTVYLSIYLSNNLKPRVLLQLNEMVREVVGDFLYFPVSLLFVLNNICLTINMFVQTWHDLEYSSHSQRVSIERSTVPLTLCPSCIDRSTMSGFYERRAVASSSIKISPRKLWRRREQQFILLAPQMTPSSRGILHLLWNPRNSFSFLPPLSLPIG